MSATSTQSLATLDAIHERLEGARSLIEDRFLAGGEALVRANEILSRLLDSVEGIVTAMDDGSAAEATSRLAATVARLKSLAENEASQQEGLDAVVKDGNAIVPLITDMQKTLSYLKTCAVATRITSAGMPEFAGFADDILSAVNDASSQVSAFADRVGTLNAQLKSARSGGEAAIATFGATVPSVADALLAASATIERRRRDLGKIAANAAKLAEGVRAKVSRILSLLQIGDMTRQRIEHVQTGISIFRSLAVAEPPEVVADATIVVSQLLLAQVRASARDLDDGSRDIVSMINGFGQDAAAILALRSGSTGFDIQSGNDAIATIESAVARSRAIVQDIAAAGVAAAQARTTTLDTANDLLSNMGSIGNLRNVKDDIRCLAINAYLRCYRMGSKGRSVGVIATELSTYAERLGVSAAGVLQRLSKMKEAATMLSFAEDSGHDELEAQIEGAAAVLSDIAARTDRHQEEMLRHGEAVSQRIGQFANELDFQSNLGDALTSSAAMLESIIHFAIKPETDQPLVTSFSERLYPLYTMASERDIHRGILPVSHANTEMTRTACNKADQSDDELFEDALF